MKETKVWGEVEHVFSSDAFAVSDLQIQPRTFCSVHKHAHRHNQFTVVDGFIKVHIFSGTDEPMGMVRTILLRPRETCVVQAGVWHQFESVKASRVIELYWTGTDQPVQLDDIVRHSLGGVCS